MFGLIFNIGDSLTFEIEKGILAADAVICFLTKDYVKAKNCKLLLQQNSAIRKPRFNLF